MIKQKKIKLPFSLSGTLAVFSLMILSACTPHPATGTWIYSAKNDADFVKIIVHFDAKLEIFSAASKEPVFYCGWSATSENNLNISCMSFEDQEVNDIYQFKVTSKNTAELLQEGKVIAAFIQPEKWLTEP